MYLCIRSPKQRFIRTFVSRPHFPAQRKGGGISKEGNPPVHLFGSVRSTRFIKPGAHFQGNKCCRSEQASREKQPVRAAAAEGRVLSGEMRAGCRDTRVCFRTVERV